MIKKQLYFPSDLSFLLPHPQSRPKCEYNLNLAGFNHEYFYIQTEYMTLFYYNLFFSYF